MTDQHQSGGRDFAGAVSDAAQHVAESAAAREEAVERRKPKSRGAVFVGTLLLFAGVIVWDYQVLTAIPEGLSPDIIREDLRFSVGTLAAEIDLFRAQEGRLPTRAEMEEEQLLDEDMIYVVEDDGYSITARDEDISVTYDSSVPLERWVTIGGDSP